MHRPEVTHVPHSIDVLGDNHQAGGLLQSQWHFGVHIAGGQEVLKDVGQAARITHGHGEFLLGEAVGEVGGALQDGEAERGQPLLETALEVLLVQVATH